MFNINLENNIEVGNVKIVQNYYNVLFSIDETFYLDDTIDYIIGYCHRLNNLEFDSILVGGFGLGIIPYYVENHKNATIIDSVEINPNVIQATSQLNHLTKTNVFNDDFYTYEPTKTYDLILVDLWWLTDNNFSTQKENLITKYSQYLNPNGKIYFPIIDELI